MALASSDAAGSNISPFGTPTEFTEDEIYATLRAGYEFVRDVRPLLMICHPPPFDTRCDRIRSGKPVGSTAARQFYRKGKARRLHLGAHPRIRRRGHDRADADSQRGPVQGRRLYSSPHRSTTGRLDARLEFL